MIFLKFLISKMFLKNLLLAVVIIPLVVALIFLVLKIYTHHGQAFQVPDFSGMSLEEVEQVCEKKDLRFEISDSIFLSSKKRGTIVEQNPGAGFKVKQNRTIFLTINAFNQLKVKMPDVVGGSVRQAKVSFETYGLKIGRLNYTQDRFLNNVLEQKFNGVTIKKGELIEKGSYIDLVVGNGMSGSKTAMPNLINLSLNDARDDISDAFLNLGNSYFDETVEDYQDSMSAKVWRQYPEYVEDFTMRLGRNVNIWLTLDESKIKLIEE